MFNEEAWLAVREGRERRDLRPFELVLAARGIDSRVDYDSGIWRLLVAADDLLASNRELVAYARENAPAPAPALPQAIDSGIWGAAAYLAAIWLVMACDAAGALGADWQRAGRLHVAALADGELWRLATALTLHADAGHLIANSLFGGAFGLLVGRYLGSGLGWLCIVAGGIAGNALNALARPEAFSSIGASTATFAAVGIGAAFMWRSGYFRDAPWQRAFAPIFAAIALFAYTGIGDENTDVLAHLTGLAAGLGIGLAVSRWRLQRIDARAQRFCALLAAGSIALGWFSALG